MGELKIVELSCVSGIAWNKEKTLRAITSFAGD